MKRPQSMTMRELIALPIDEDQAELFIDAGGESSKRDFGGAFKGDDGHVWGTRRLAAGWVRYPAHLALPGGSDPGRLA